MVTGTFSSAALFTIGMNNIHDASPNAAIDNETNSGMLWPTGKVSGTTGFGNLAGLVNSGYNATKAVFPSASVIVHLANGYDDATFRWFFDNLKSQGGKWDVTGISHSPSASNWTTPEFGDRLDDGRRRLALRQTRDDLRNGHALGRRADGGKHD